MAPFEPKTFTDPDGDKLNVYTPGDRLDGVEVVSIITQDGDDGDGTLVHLRKADAPAAALAILEAAGYEANRPFEGGILTEAGQAMYLLGRVVADLERTAAKAADEAKLDEEAVALFKAVCPGGNYPHSAREHYLTLARAAREIHADKEAK